MPKIVSTWLCLVLIPLFLVSGCAGNNRAPVRDLEKPRKVTWGSHKVTKGETLYAIAWRYGRDYRELARSNGIRSPYLLQPGQVIKLSPAKKTQVSKKTKPPVKTKSSSPKKQSAKKESVKVAAPGPVQWRWPVNGKVVGTFSTWGENKGLNIAAAKGTAVKAAAAGTVVYAGSGLIGYGNLVIIKHNETYLSAYAHNRKIVVAEKNKVKAGQKIAEIGSTGSNKVMLHFEIRKNGKPVNPLQYLPK